MEKIGDSRKLDYCTITVHISPGSKKNEIVGLNSDGSIRMKIAAPPVEGRANAELFSFLGKLLNTSTSRFQLIHGEKSKHKFIKILGLSFEEVKLILNSSPL